MKFNKIIIFAALLLSNRLEAQDSNKKIASTTIYVGSGRGEVNTNRVVSNAIPWTVGFISRFDKKEAYWGLDISGEGTSINNTSGKRGVVEQGISANFLAGGSKEVTIGGPVAGGIGLLIGMRRTGQSCPDSYLGFRCYADREPTMSYDLNLGAMIHFAVSRATIGARITPVSTQFIAGVNF